MRRRMALIALWCVADKTASQCIDNVCNQERIFFIVDPERREKDETSIYYSSINPNDDDMSRLRSGIQLSVDKGIALLLDEDIKIHGTLYLPPKTKIIGGGKWLVQTRNNTPLFVCEGPGVRVFHEVNCRGVGRDYTSNWSVYEASGIVAKSEATIIVESCQLMNFAGAGVRLMSGAKGCRILNTKITGPGAEFIHKKTNNYGGCIVVDVGVGDWIIDGCDLSLSAQGVVTGDHLSDVRISNNTIHDISGQHALYIESGVNIKILDNTIYNIPLQGIKIQIGSIDARDADGIIIENNRLSSIDSHGILLTNPVGTQTRLRNFIIKGNLLAEIGESSFSLNSCADGIIEGNVVKVTARGFYLKSCSRVKIIGNDLVGVAKEGMIGVDIEDASLVENRIEGVDFSEVSKMGEDLRNVSSPGLEVVGNKIKGFRRNGAVLIYGKSSNTK